MRISLNKNARTKSVVRAEIAVSDETAAVLAKRNGALHQQSYAQLGQLRQQEWALPHNGHAQQDLIGQIEQLHYHYDGRGNRTRSAQLSDGSCQELRYDSSNQLVAIGNYSPQGELSHVSRYRYDSLGRRIAQTLQTYTQGKATGLEAIYYGWDGDRLTYTHSRQGTTSTLYEPGSFTPLIQLYQAAQPHSQADQRCQTVHHQRQKWPGRDCHRDDRQDRWQKGHERLHCANPHPRLPSHARRRQAGTTQQRHRTDQLRPMPHSG